MASRRIRSNLTSLASIGAALVLAMTTLVTLQAFDARPDGGAIASAKDPCDLDGNGTVDGWEAAYCKDSGDPGKPGPGPGKPEPPDPNRTETEHDKRSDCKLPGGGDYPDDQATEECLRYRDRCPDGEPFWMLWERHRKYKDNVPGKWSEWTSPDAGCGEPPPPPPSPEEVRAFLGTKVPKPAPNLQPNNKTLVGIDTVFSTKLDHTKDEPFKVETTMNGYTIEIEGWPTAFRWNFGDGSAPHTPDKGNPYPQAGWRDVLHKYKKAGKSTVDVDIQWKGHFRVGQDGSAGEWQDLPDLFVTNGPTDTVVIVESRPVLSGRN